MAKNFAASTRDPQLENVPYIAGLLRDLRDACGGDREFDRVAGDLFRTDMNLACSRQRLGKVVAWFDQGPTGSPPSCRAILEHLRSLAAAQYTYERDRPHRGSREAADVRRRRCPTTHSFLANGVFSHNTTVALHAIANAQRAGGIAAFIDAEHALDPEYAGKLGVDTDALLVSQPDTGEQALEIADMLIRSGALDIIVIDSVAALVPRAEIEGEMGDSHVGLQARLMSQALRKITGALNQSKTTAIFINQLREKIGVMFGSPETTSGGKALKFYASIRLDVRRIETLKDGTDPVGQPGSGQGREEQDVASVQAGRDRHDVRHRHQPRGRPDRRRRRAGLRRKSGAWYTYEGDQLGQGKENSRAFLRDNPDLANELEKRIKEKLGIGAQVDKPLDDSPVGVVPAPAVKPSDV